MNKKMFLMCCLLIIISSCSNNTKLAKIRVTDLKHIAMIPIYLAKELGYFKEENIEIDFIFYPTGEKSINGLFNNEIDISLSMDMIVTKNIMKNRNLYILSSFAKTNKIRGIICSKKSGITVGSDLKGKKIGISLGTSTDYELALYLNSFGLDLSDVILIDILPMDIVHELELNNIDAMISWYPITENALKENKGSISLPITSTYNISLFTSTPEYIENNIKNIQGFYIAIFKAIDYMKENPNDELLFIKKYIPQISEENFIALNNIYYDISLDNLMLQSMKNQQVWINKDNKVEFKKYLYKDVLLTLHPEKVTYVE